MFCNQCEQTARSAMGAGCLIKGECGKTAEEAALQEDIFYMAQGIAMYARRARQLDAGDRGIDAFILSILFTTLTNVNFDDDKLFEILKESAEKLIYIRGVYEAACHKAGGEPEKLSGPATWTLTQNLTGAVKHGERIAMLVRRGSTNEDIDSLRLLIKYGIKGVAAYAHHAQVLGKEDDSVYDALEEVLEFLANNPTDIDSLLAWVLKLGEVNVTVLGLLDSAHTSSFGAPEPTSVRTTVLAGKAILVSGHDIQDLEHILQQTEGKGINVYTHGEMLPANAYPEIKKYSHLVGNFGGAWQDQQTEFAQFPGAIIMTSNCLIEPMPEYNDRIFTTGPVGWSGIPHIDNEDFSPVIEAALAAPGFKEDTEKQTIPIGFAHNAVMNVADKVIDAVKAGKIKHFFVIGGCDGAKTGRNYFTEFATAAPDDCIVMTLGCGKYRFNQHDFGTIGGIPRLLDLGQCNDSYSAVKIAMALSNAFNCEINDLPLTLIVSWFEQKAVAVLLSLLHLGIKNIHLGPSLPTFISPNVLQILVDKFELRPTGVAQDDLNAILN
ncbi:MAG: hydroxylamine reductase [Gammaproteobacteria bacterium]|nr:hydroxylamine reductase [Gammaproteobacteria bacterium]